MANSWRTTAKESELSVASYDTSLKIAREELVMVERNYERVQDENRRLKQALQYADNVVYGPAQQSLLQALQQENRKGKQGVVRRDLMFGGGYIEDHSLRLA